jgi:predicted DCC family thiol-disulfide oxidoreductase YuxK
MQAASDTKIRFIVLSPSLKVVSFQECTNTPHYNTPSVAVKVVWLAAAAKNGVSTFCKTPHKKKCQPETIMPELRLKLLYDGECPFCRREAQWLKRRDRAGRLVLEDISALGFDPSRYGLARQEVMDVLHGVLPDGRIVRGVEALRQAYQAIGLGWLVAPTRLPVVRGALDRMYAAFARNRVGLGRWFGRRCQGGVCSMLKTQDLRPKT